LLLFLEKEEAFLKLVLVALVYFCRLLFLSIAGSVSLLL
jgi:hypothetical protein